MDVGRLLIYGQFRQGHTRCWQVHGNDQGTLTPSQPGGP